MTSSVSVENISRHSITASNVILILSESVRIYCAKKKTFEFDSFYSNKNYVCLKNDKVT